MPKYSFSVYVNSDCLTFVLDKEENVIGGDLDLELEEDEVVIEAEDILSALDTMNRYIDEHEEEGILPGYRFVGEIESAPVSPC